MMNTLQKQSGLIGGFALVLLVNMSSSPAYAEIQMPSSAHSDSSTLGSSTSKAEQINQQRLLLQNSSKRPAQCYDSGLC